MSGNDQASLEPPIKTSTGEHGTHDLDSSDSEDHFSDAQSGLEQLSGSASPVGPVSRLKNVDSKPSAGEIQDTEGYEMRGMDAQPVQVPIVPKSEGDVSAGMAVKPRDRSLSEVARSKSPIALADLPISNTRVEKDYSGLSHGEIPGTKTFEKREADAEPDIVEQIGDIPESPTSTGFSYESQIRENSASAGKQTTSDEHMGDFRGNEGDDLGDDFGDDFDDFEEGEEDAFQEGRISQSQPVSITLIPVLDFAKLDSAESIQAAAIPYATSLFPPDTIEIPVFARTISENPVFLSPRSASLWAQLVAPPPLLPPNWIRSRIRRLFLVSLGVPVDLDEILPASKQKKLVLPSMHSSAISPRTSTDSRPISRLKQDDGNGSSTSLDSQGKPSRADSRRKKRTSRPPQLDLVLVRQLCTVTDEALSGLTLPELREHVKKLEIVQGTAKEVLDYWTKKTDEKLGDREAFEGVIENLVKHARKSRK